MPDVRFWALADVREAAGRMSGPGGTRTLPDGPPLALTGETGLEVSDHFVANSKKLLVKLGRKTSKVDLVEQVPQPSQGFLLRLGAVNEPPHIISLACHITPSNLALAT